MTTAESAPRPSERAPETSTFSAVLGGRATPVSFGVDRVATMADAQTLTLVESGSIDLFAVDLGEILHAEALLPRGGQVWGSNGGDRSSARWTFLCRLEAGAMMVGAPSGEHLSLLGRPLPDARVSRLPIGALRPLTFDGEAGPDSEAPSISEIVTALEKGLVALSDGVRVNLAPRSFTAVSGGETVTVPDGTPVRLVQGAGWLWVASGRLTSGGNPDEPTVEAGETVFATGADWFVADSDCVVRGLNTETLLVEDFLWEALQRQQARYLRSVDKLIERRQERAAALLESRRSQDERVVDRALSGFTALVEHGAAAGEQLGVRAGSAELAVMSLVLGRLGLRAVQPTASAGVGRATDEVNAIALASGLRTRSLRLLGSWWRSDAGPLAGFRQDGAPVALLWTRRGYTVMDPEDGSTKRVNAEIASGLSQHATMVYRPLPPGTRGPASLLRFAMTGCRRDVVTLVLSGLAVALLGLLVPILTGTIFGTLVPRSERGLIILACTVILISGVVSAFFDGVQNLSLLRLEGRTDATLQAGIWDRILALPLRFFTSQSTGELTTSALAVDVVRETLSGVATTATLACFTGLLNLILLFFYSVQLALIAIGLVAVAFSMCVFLGRRQIRSQRAIFEVERKLSSRVFQLLTGLGKLRVAAAESRAFAVWAGQFSESRALNLQARRMQNVVGAFNAGFVLISTFVVFALVGTVLHLSTAAFLSFFAAFALLLASTLQFTGIAITVLSVVPLVENLDPILACEPEVSADKSSPGELSGDIELRHVNFRYSEEGPLVLDDVSLRMRPGEFVAVVGPTGCGKSTLVRLLLGFDAPHSGSVLYDGQDLSQLDLLAVRRQCGVVLQNGALMAGDIRSNIVGNAPYTLDEAWEAARMSGLDVDIDAMPLGMYTVLSDGANTLSGGQRQRLMIARALVSRPRILIMDEATSALDNPTQAKVTESTRQLHATRIVIAHRLSTIRHADRIVVLDAGRIVQQGTYDDLIADDAGMFARLARRQLA